ncbi:MAG: heme-binding protein [Nostoc sp.]|uniref:GlcG/HbpS family heme-binding protein n=1 Tax=Nostoc sp. TaxID=1180 RepID=UPI002FF9FD0D
MISFIDDTPLNAHISTIERITMTSDKHSVSLDDARGILAAGEAKARAIGQPMNLAVIDAGGNLVAHIRMDRAWIGSIDISINKAFTARAFDLSTKSLAEDAQPGKQFYGIHASNGGRIMIFAGGIPLQRDEQIVGAIGVSGGSGEQDQAVAEAAVAAF